MTMSHPSRRRRNLNERSLRKYWRKITVRSRTLRPDWYVDADCGLSDLFDMFVKGVGNFYKCKRFLQKETIFLVG